MVDNEFFAKPSVLNSFITPIVSINQKLNKIITHCFIREQVKIKLPFNLVCLIIFI